MAFYLSTAVTKKSYLSPKVRAGASKTGRGLFAIAPIRRGELLIDFTNGPGQLVGLAEADRLYAEGNDRMIRVSDDLYFSDTTVDELEDVDLVNHSCEPNCGMRGNFGIVAMRNITSGEEITIDYAMLENADYTLRCLCGNARCRGVVTGYDWKKPSLQRKYRGYFTEYVTQKIASAADG